MKKILFFAVFLGMTSILNAQWSDNSKVNSLISQDGVNGNSMTKVAQTSDGMCYVSWTSGGIGFKVRLQLIDKDGKPMWSDGGISISDHLSATWTTDYTLGVTNDDCAVLTFSDSRNDPGKGYFEPYVYKISKTGELLWGADGIKVPYESFAGLRPRLCVTNSNNVIVGFTDASDMSATKVTFTKFSADGAVMWSGLEIPYASMVNFIPSGKDGFILTYYLVSGSAANLYAQRYNANGEAMWGEPIAIDDTGRVGAKNEPHVLSDGEDGALVLYGISISSSEFYVMLQRVSPDGDLMMGLDGVKCSDTYEIHSSGRFAVDVERGEVFVFETCYQTGYRTLRINKFDMNGGTIWDSQGVPFGDGQMYSHMTFGVAPTGDGGAIVVYTRTGSATVNSDLLASKIEADATFRWSDVPISDVESKKGRVENSLFFNDQVCVFWEDSRNGTENGSGFGQIFGQNISIDGKLGVTGVGMEDLRDDLSMNVYPNPATDFISINCDENIVVKSLTVYDLSGREVKSVNHDYNRVDVRDINSGVYLVKVTLESGDSLVCKIVIK